MKAPPELHLFWKIEKHNAFELWYVFKYATCADNIVWMNVYLFEMPATDLEFLKEILFMSCSFSITAAKSLKLINRNACNYEFYSHF